jgi:hypothetical protein
MRSRSTTTQGAQGPGAEVGRTDHAQLKEVFFCLSEEARVERRCSEKYFLILFP